MNLSWEQTKTAPVPILLSGLCLSQFEVTELGAPGSPWQRAKGAGETLRRSPLQSAVTLKLSVRGTRRAQGVQVGEKTREMHADLFLACKDAAERLCSAPLCSQPSCHFPQRWQGLRAPTSQLPASKMFEGSCMSLVVLGERVPVEVQK